MTLTIRELQAVRRALTAQAAITEDATERDELHEMAGAFALLAEQAVGAAIEARAVPIEVEHARDVTGVVMAFYPTDARPA